MSDKTCECEEPWWDTDLQGRDYPCRKCGGTVPNFPDMMEMRSPTGRTGKPLVMTNGVWADLLQGGESFEIMEADGSRRRVKKEDVEIVNVDFGEIEARAFVIGSEIGGKYVIDPETYGVREYDEFRNRQLEAYAEGVRSAAWGKTAEAVTDEIEAGEMIEPPGRGNRRARRARAAQARKRWK